MTRRKWLAQYWLAVATGAAFVLWAALSAGWLLDAAHNSSDWLRGKLVDEGLWVAAVFCVWSVAALVAARVLALFVLPGKKSELRENDWWFFTGGGLALTLLGTGAWTLVGTVDRVAVFYVVVLFAVGSVVAGIIMLGLGLGQRLRLQINVIGPDGTTSAVKSAFVAARMEAMGTSRPRGLDFPHGTDVANLPETALSTAATNESKIVAALLTLFRSIAFIIPWKAEVVIMDSETAAVTLRRNGRRLDSQLISTSLLLPDGPKREEGDADRAVLTAAAAFILFSLSTVYPKLKEGMSGATNWRGVAAQVLATTVPWKNNDEASMELFARAVNEDPGNMAAWLGYLVKRAGYYGTVDTLEWVIAKLKTLDAALDQVDPHKDKEIALRIRLLRNLTIFQTNYRLLLDDEGSAEKGEKAVRGALKSASSLIDLVASVVSSKTVAGGAYFKPQPALLEYVEKVRPLTASLYLHAAALASSIDDRHPLCEEEPKKLKKKLQRLKTAQKWMPKERKELASLRFHYDRACALMEERPKDHDRALLPHLELALTLKQLKTGVESDPSLEPLRYDERFAALIDANVRIDIESLKALTGYSEKLAADGIRFASEFLARKNEVDDFVKVLTVSKKTVAWMTGICELAEGCPVRVMAAEWTNLLTDDGITDMAALRGFVRRQDGAGSPRLARRAELAGVAAPRKIDLKRWAGVSTSL